MTPDEYIDLKEKLIEMGYADEIDWCEEVNLCVDAKDFAFQCLWVIVNSGMKNQIAKIIYERILEAICEHKAIESVFGHKGKVLAINHILKNRDYLHRKFLDTEDKISFLETLPWIGKITKYHLGRNLGLDCVKPDRHLVRIGKSYKMKPFEMCKKLADVIGDRIGTIDVVIWRAANLGLI